MRSASSVRFADYYKIQVWQARSLAWLDIQRAYPSVASAIAAAPSGQRDRDWRIMLVTSSGRRPLPE